MPTVVAGQMRFVTQCSLLRDALTSVTCVACDVTMVCSDQGQWGVGVLGCDHRLLWMCSWLSWLELTGWSRRLVQCLVSPVQSQAEDFVVFFL